MSRISILALGLLTAVTLSRATRIPVTIVDFAFQPDTVRIGLGDSVIWTNSGTFTHTSTSGINGVGDGLWDSGDLTHGATFVHGFPANGTFPYFCRHHYLSGMKGAVVVGTGAVNEMPDRDLVESQLTASPNPFRQSTKIRYVVPNQGPVTVSVVDVLGQVVRVLQSGVLTAGEHSFTWDGRYDAGTAVPDGVYFARLSTGAGSFTSRLVLAR